MTVNFYVHAGDLDQLNKLLKSKILDEKEYQIETFRSIDNAPDVIKNNLILVGINYEDFMRIEDFLIFQ